MTALFNVVVDLWNEAMKRDVAISRAFHRLLVKCRMRRLAQGFDAFLTTIERYNAEVDNYNQTTY